MGKDGAYQLKASVTTVYPDEGLPGPSKEAQHQRHFYLYQCELKDRRFKHSKESAVRATVTAKARTTGKSSGFIFTIGLVPAIRPNEWQY
ncbi:hypothetical protein [Izhakiella capsodis]